MPYDPLATGTKHTQKKLEALFKGDSRVLQRLRIENPALYAEYRQAYMGEPGYTTRAQVDRLRMNERQHEVSEHEQESRLRFDKETCEKFYKSGANAGLSVDKLRKTDPVAYDLLKTAAESYGVIPRNERAEVRLTPKRAVIEPTPKYAADAFPLSVEQSRKCGLPEGLMMTPEEFGQRVIFVEGIRRQMAEERVAAEATTNVAGETK